MNKGDARESAKILTAYADGLIIQFKERESTHWTDNTTCLSFDFSQCDYRIKPKPRRLYVTFNDDGTVKQCTPILTNFEAGEEVIMFSEDMP